MRVLGAVCLMVAGAYELLAWANGEADLFRLGVLMALMVLIAEKRD